MNEPSTSEKPQPPRSGRRRFVLPALIAAAAAGLLALLAFGISRQTDSSSLDARVAAGQMPAAPGATVRLPVLGSSSTRDLDDYRGKVMVLNVFASWCTGCQAEAPMMAREQHVLARHDATIVGVSYEDNASSTSSFDRQYGVRYPVLRDPSGNLARALGAFYVPETFILNRQGRIVALNRYQITGSWLRGHLASLLNTRA
jgi:cytochrome c biogenesis protein CcmG/thiol:disulfide interchange protein DsbE